MPNTKSAKKRHRQSQVRRQRNRAAKSVLKSQVRKVREAITAGEVEKATEELRTTTKKLDQTAARGIIHRNVASRLKSRLSAALKQAKPNKDGSAKVVKTATPKAESAKKATKTVKAKKK
jgi:small subunit ribosomal protein S20